MKISELSEQFLLITDSCQVAEIRNDLHLDMQECDSLFVELDNDGSDYEVVYGFKGIVPNSDKELALLFSGRGGRI
ncbi:MAG: hypothetical protein Q7T18_03300 [Sedimentisphaerales bacterium]|nr:hypothetical protein [Sedimentisphaerales bacterium]